MKHVHLVAILEHAAQKDFTHSEIISSAFVKGIIVDSRNSSVEVLG